MKTSEKLKAFVDSQPLSGYEAKAIKDIIEDVEDMEREFDLLDRFAEKVRKIQEKI